MLWDFIKICFGINMQLKHRFIKQFFKLAVLIAIIECIYLFFIPFMVNKIIYKESFHKFIENKTNIVINYKNPEIKTYLLPYLSIKADNINIKDSQKDILYANNLDVKISLLPLLIKKMQFKYLRAQNLDLNIIRDKQGNFNFQKLFQPKKNSIIKISYNNALIDIENYKIKALDEEADKVLEVNGQSLLFKSNKDKIYIKTKGDIVSDNNKSEYETEITSRYPIDIKKFNKDFVKGSIYLYNIKASELLPYINYIDNLNITRLDGIVEFLQLSASNSDENENNIVVNTKFKDIVFDKSNWKNHINIKGENKINANVDLFTNTIKINSFNYNADKINISADGTIRHIEDNADKNKLGIETDINVEVKDSKAENIASILPPTLVPKYMTIDKIKTYGVYGDIEGKINVKGELPQPDITGYVKGRNVHVLDKSLHKLHKGTVDIVFDKRILNLNILVDMYNKQKAYVNGYVYMFRDGINNVKVKTTNNIDFPLAQKIIIPVSKVFNFQLGPIPDMNITSGKGVIDIHIQGNMDFVNIDGFSKFDKAKLTYNGLFGEIYEGKGRLDFKKDIISFKSEKAYVKGNSLKVKGKVKINSDLDFDISSDKAQAKDLIEIINKSSLLKDVKAGIAVITEASGPVDLFLNIKAKIVPVPFGQPPLPPEEAFKDMKVNGSVKLLNNVCYLQGFFTPLENVNGLTKFTETVVDLIDIQGISGTSPLTVNGKIITDIKTKVPDVDVVVTSDSVNLKDTIKFLTQSYLYPKNYPDLSVLYDIPTKHDLYFKYKAKSVDFVTDKAYAVMNFIKDSGNDFLNTQSGKVILDKSTVKVEDVLANLFNSDVKIQGNVKKIDTIKPEYNLKITSEKFNLENLNDINEYEIIPQEIKNILEKFENYHGIIDVILAIDGNKLNGDINVYNAGFIEATRKIPVLSDDFRIKFNNNKLHIKNMTGLVGDMPFYIDGVIENIYDNPQIKGYFTSKITNTFIKQYLPENISENVEVTGDVNLSSKVIGNMKNINITPKLTLHKEADISYFGTNVGEINDEREFVGDININGEDINIKNLSYIKYVSSQNNKIYPLLFASVDGKLKINSDNVILPEELNIKTDKNLSAKILNLFIGKPLFKQGTLNCDLKYKFDKITHKAKLLGSLNCRNINIPLFDTIVKHIQINTNEEDIKVNIFGFITDGKITVDSVVENNFTKIPRLKSLNIYAEQIDNNKLLEEFYKTKQALNEKKKTESGLQIPDLEIENGYLEIKKLTIKSLVATNFTSNFSIDKDGIFKAHNLKVNVGEGNVQGKISYNLNNTDLEGSLELNDVDSNYIAETLFEGQNQIYGNANGKLILSTKGFTHEEIIKNLSGFVYFDITDGNMPKLGSLEYLLRASNIIKSGITGLTLNSILEILNLVKTGYFSSIIGSCVIEEGVAKNIEIFSKGENLSLYIKGNYDIANTYANMEILGKLSKRISTIFGALGNTSLNTFFKLIPGISLLDFGRKDFIEDVEKIPPFTGGDYESRTFQAIINGDINEKSGYVQSFKWVK